MVAAGAKALLVGARDHVQRPLGLLGLTLGQVAELGDLRAHIQHGRRVGTGRDTRATADAGGGVHGEVGFLLGDRHCVGVGGAADVDGDIAAGLLDAIEGRAIDHQIAQHREGTGAPRLNDDFVAILEVAHMQLARRGTRLGPMCLAVDHQRAHATDAFTAVVVESDGLFALADEVFVHEVEHLQEALLRGDFLGLVGLEVAIAGRLLPPYLQGQIEELFTTG